MTTFETIFSSISAGRVLDVATGRGSFIHALIGSLKNYDDIIGIDTAAETKAIFAETFADKPISYQQMDAYTLEFDDASFDTVCIANSLHHLNDPVRVLSEMTRVLKPGGRFIISEMMQDNLSEPQMTHMLLHHWWAAVDTAEGIVHNETFTRQELMDFAKSTSIKKWAFHDVSYLDDDPKNEETINQLDQIIDRYMQKTEKLPDQEMLIKRGQALRERVHEVGFHGATALVAIGVK
ncbi:MAG: class I SAM-dependent methyltransferase [Anaerolineae bacterium]|nr:class I SAM-dependent methyltransferase [Anaerolineae bacterium]MBT7069721.1 class I SAM-dependent methyltransferase [Anaerolineae bacterium]MBT7326735.1 class I SAM-dependent methyltransferase [Anaerolineae bacterium]